MGLEDRGEAAGMKGSGSANSRVFGRTPAGGVRMTIAAGRVAPEA
jgi:hypothetical protein